MVTAYRALNKPTVENRYPSPRIDDLFDKMRMQGSHCFTSHGNTDLAEPMLLILSAATRHTALLLC